MFTTPMAWLILFAWTMVTNGLFFLTGIEPASGDMPMAQPLYVSALDAGAWLLTLLAPAITMNAFAQERQQGSMQLLMTVPVREWQVIFGKYAASLVMLSTLVVATLVHVIILHFISDTGGRQVVAGYLGLILLCSFYAALGIWISLLVESPVVAYVITFGVIALLHLFGLAAGGTGWLSAMGEWLGIANHQQPFTQGDIRLANVLWFVAATGIALTLAHGAMCSRRIHGL